MGECLHRFLLGSHTVQPSYAAVFLLVTACSSVAAQDACDGAHDKPSTLTRQELGKQNNTRQEEGVVFLQRSYLVCLHTLALVAAAVVLWVWHSLGAGQPRQHSSPPSAPWVQRMLGPATTSDEAARQRVCGICSPFATQEERNVENEEDVQHSNAPGPSTPPWEDQGRSRKIRKSLSLQDLASVVPPRFASQSTASSAPQLAGQSCVHSFTLGLSIRRARSVFNALPSSSTQHWPKLASSLTLSSLLPTTPPAAQQEPAQLQAADGSCAICSRGSNSHSNNSHKGSANSNSNHSLDSSAGRWAMLGHAPSAPTCRQSMQSTRSLELKGLLPGLECCLSDEEEGGGSDNASHGYDGGWARDWEEGPQSMSTGEGGSEITLDWGNTGLGGGALDATLCKGGSWQGMGESQQCVLPRLDLEIREEGQQCVLPRFDLEIGEGKDLQINEKHLLGFGSTGCVYMGQLTLGADGVVPVAVKVLSDASLNHRQLFSEARGADSMLAEFQREALILARSMHPNIVHCYGGSLRPCTSKPAFIVQELCEASLHALMYDPFLSPTVLGQLAGSSCADSSSRMSLRTGVGRLLPLRRALEVASDVASALVYLHPRVLHRDIKSANVLLSADGTAKLGDMGLSMVKPSGAAQHEVHESYEEGTIAYLAPECMCFSPSEQIILTEKVDVYSFGVLLNELVTGTRPFFGMTTPVLRVRVALGVARPELPAAAAASSLPEGLVPLIQACWAQEPENRPPATGVRAALQAMLAELKE